MLAKVELSDEAFTAIGLVLCSRTADRSAAGGEVSRRSFACHHVEAHAVHSEPANIESLTGGDERRVGLLAVWQPYLAVVRAQQRNGIAGSVVDGVSEDFDAELVVSYLPEDVAVACRYEVIELVDATVASQRQDALFREEIVEFELA